VAKGRGSLSLEALAEFEKEPNGSNEEGTMI